MEKEFYKEVRARNKALFIDVCLNNIEVDEVDIPKCILAEELYNAFKSKNLLDEYGYIKEIA